MLSFLIDLQGRMIGALRREEGQGLVEYGLILAFVSVVAIAALTFLGNDVTSLLSKVGNSLA
jgi:pilus assembly protein Flp/PilA